MIGSSNLERSPNVSNIESLHAKLEKPSDKRDTEIAHKRKDRMNGTTPSPTSSQPLAEANNSLSCADETHYTQTGTGTENNRRQEIIHFGSLFIVRHHHLSMEEHSRRKDYQSIAHSDKTADQNERFQDRKAPSMTEMKTFPPQTDQIVNV